MGVRRAEGPADPMAGAGDGASRAARARAVGGVLLLMLALQAGRWAFESLVFCLVPHTLLSNEVVRIVSYLLMTGAVLLLARRRGVCVRWLPRDAAGGVRLGPGYLASLAVLAALLVSTPFVTGRPDSALVWVELACAALATPLCEETVFRGYAWGRLEPAFGGGWALVLASAVLFGLWHLGYTDAVAWRIAQPDVGVGAGLAAVMLGKVLFGAAIGFVFGALRMKWGTCLPSGILHGIWNTLA